MKYVPRLLVLAALIAVVVLAAQYRDALDPTALKAQVQDFGLWAPVVFIALFAIAYPLNQSYYIPGPASVANKPGRSRHPHSSSNYHSASGSVTGGRQTESTHTYAVARPSIWPRSLNSGTVEGSASGVPSAVI